MTMNKIIARRIGRNLAIVSTLIGIAIVYVFGMMWHWWDAYWILDFEFRNNVAVAALGGLVAAYFFGQSAGTDILIGKRNEYWTGIMYGLLVLVTGALVGCSVGFIGHLVNDKGTDVDALPDVNPFFAYYLMPLAWVTGFGITPVIVVGLWFGWQIKKQGQKEMVA